MLESRLPFRLISYWTILFIFFVESSLVVTVLLLAALFLTFRATAIYSSSFAPFSALEKPAVTLVAAVIIAVSYTLVSHRPDGDDALYLFFGLLPLDQPHQALNLLPSELFGGGRITMSYPTIEAVVSYWTGTAFLKMYYLLLPSLAAMLSVFAYYGLFQRLGAGPAGLLTLMTIIVLILWGDVHRAPGNFAFPRLYQGKAIFYAVVCPYLVSAALDVLTRRPGSNLRLAAASISGIGFTSSAIVLVPLFFAGMILTTWLSYRENLKSGRQLPFLAGFTLYLLLAGAVVAYLGKNPIQGSDGYQLGFNLRDALNFCFGDSLRGALGIAGVGLLPLLAQDTARHRAVVATSAALMLVALNPILVFLVDQTVGSLTWRLQWLLPVAAAAAASIYLGADFISRGNPQLRVLFCVVALVGFATSGQATFSSSNNNRIGIPQLKLPTMKNGAFVRRNNSPGLWTHLEYRLENGRICMANGCY